MYDPKIVDVAIISNGRATKSGVKTLAIFTLLVRPMRIVGCSLVLTRHGYSVWTPDRSLKIMRDAMPEITDEALRVYKEACAELAT